MTANDRYCPNGLLEMEMRHGRRVVRASLVQELRRQQAAIAAYVAEPRQAAA